MQIDFPFAKSAFELHNFVHGPPDQGFRLAAEQARRGAVG